ncbi:MAG: glycosyltransferase [Lachnospiraceae bacterium]|nr:glycosyltransferase [Lachnospiraceae bacterium]
MRILFINSTCGIGSTGRICTDLAKSYEKDGHECQIAYGRGIVPLDARRFAMRINTERQVRFNALSARLFDNDGLAAKRETKAFIRWAEAYNPDFLWLHNLHGYYINIELLFAWIKTRPNMKVYWTLHDCWSFTGHCAYFTLAKCEKWKHHCMNCSQKLEYPASYGADSSLRNYDRKRAAFLNVSNMTLITPSKWLADLLCQSFLGCYPTKVRYNRIDTGIFRPTPSDFRERYGLKDKKIILGVANVWSKSKGLDDLLKLASMLDDRYAMVLVGLSKKQMRTIARLMHGYEVETSTQQGLACDEAICTKKSGNTIGCVECSFDDLSTDGSIQKPTGTLIPIDVNVLYQAITTMYHETIDKKTPISKILLLAKTNSAYDLAKIYTAADCYVNPTYEDNYPTTNIEALSCGTNVITYDTGGCAETLANHV